MSRPKERTFLDAFDATSSLYEHQFCWLTGPLCACQIPVLRRNCRMQVPVLKADHIDKVIPQTKGFSCSGRSQKVDYRSKSGTCNVCSAPCSSCFHGNHVFMRTPEESTGETHEEHTVVDWDKKGKIRQLGQKSIVETMSSSADSSENTVHKADLRTSNASASDDAVTLSGFEPQKVSEGCDACLTCDTGTKDTSKMLILTMEKVHNANPPCPAESTSYSIAQRDEQITSYQTLSQDENKKIVVDRGGINYSRRSKLRGESSDKLAASNLPIGPSSHHPGLSDIPSSKITDVTTDLLMVRHTSSIKSPFCGSNSWGIEDKNSVPLVEPLVGSYKHMSSLLIGAVVTDACHDLPASPPVSTEKNGDMKLEIDTKDEVDDSDMVEQDVKVCDICGDAGREDLLAICCRCSDGAEHTYCMREMLAKVPEGDWLCEECKCSEKVRYRRRDKLERKDENEKNNSGQASSECVNSSEVDGNRTRDCINIPAKRLKDDADAEISSVVKKSAVDPVFGTPKLSSSDKETALSRENSLKNLDKGRVQTSHGGPTADAVTGSFSKSNSFTFLNSKSKVKLVDQVLQREKSSGELAFRRLKNGSIRSIDRSMSFKSTGSIHSEAKTKMLSPRLCHIQEIKNTKRQSSFERQSSLKSECKPISSMMATSTCSTSRIDKKVPSGAELCSPPVSTNHHETKPVQPGGHLVALSRSSSPASRRSSDLSSSLGEFKKPSIYSLNTSRVSSANDVNKFDAKSNHTSPKEDSSLRSGVSETPFNAFGCRSDGFAWSGELATSGEPSKGGDSGSHFHPPDIKSFRNESYNLKAAIETAMLRKPRGYKTHRYDDSSVSSKVYEFSSKDHLSSSAGQRIQTSAVEVAESTVSRNLTAESLSRQTFNTVEHFSSVGGEALSSGGDEVRIVPLDVQSSSRDVCINISAAGQFPLKSFTIPEHECIWQGSFEIYQSDKVFASWDGIQAHVSTCASFKVMEAVNKFQSKIVLDEVPRLSTWPTQFQEHGVGEDDIALFFFAKDLESYERCYKVWLGNMIKNDLALRGSLNDFELLIFPSNQLPETSQRWNMLFFLWGVFRAKKESCLQNLPDSLKQFSALQYIPPSSMTMPVNMSTLRSLSKDSLASDNILSEPKVHASESLCGVMSTKAVNGDCGSKVSSSEWLDSGQNSSCSTASRCARAKHHHKSMMAPLEGRTNSISGPLQSTLSTVVSKSGPMLMQMDTLFHIQQPSHPSYKPSDCSLDMPPEEGKRETISILDMKTYSQDLVKSRMVDEDLSASCEVPVKEDQDSRGPNTQVNRLLLNQTEYPHHKSTSTESQALYACSGQVLPENDDTHGGPHGALEKMDHLALASRVHDACDETVIPEYSENAERCFFPLQIPPDETTMQQVDRSMVRTLLPFEQNDYSFKAPNLELALGAKTKSSTLDIQPSIIGNVERKVSKECIPDVRSVKASDDDGVASLSLSLSIPFPKEEKITKPAHRTEQLVSQKDQVTTSLLLFRGFGDK